MRRKMQIFKSIRSWLTIWHLVVLILNILVFMAISQVFLWNQLQTEMRNSLADDVEMVESLLKSEPAGITWIGHKGLDNTGNAQRWIEVLEPDGSTIYRNFVGDAVFADLQPFASNNKEKKFSRYRNRDGSILSVVQHPHRVGDVMVQIHVARSMTGIYQEMGHLLLAQALCFPFIILTACFGGYFLAGRALTPLKKIITQAQTISADNLHERIEIENQDDELGQLSLTFNSMLAKLDRSFGQVRQFTADASHEMRTPLTAIRSVAELALRPGTNEQTYRETIASILEDVEKMTNLLEDLLVMAHADDMAYKKISDVEDLGKIVKEEISLFSVLAEEKDQLLEIGIEMSCPVFVDRKSFRLAVGNVLNNAIKFTPPGKVIGIIIRRVSKECVLEITDSGSGIARQHQEKIFDRFYRIDKARSRKTGGTGLGLAIAKWAVELNGGRITLFSNEGHGCTFQIFLPVHVQKDPKS